MSGVQDLTDAELRAEIARREGASLDHGWHPSSGEPPDARQFAAMSWHEQDFVLERYPDFGEGLRQAERWEGLKAKGDVQREQRAKWEAEQKRQDALSPHEGMRESLAKQIATQGRWMQDQRLLEMAHLAGLDSELMQRAGINGDLHQRLLGIQGRVVQLGPAVGQGDLSVINLAGPDGSEMRVALARPGESPAACRARFASAPSQRRITPGPSTGEANGEAA